MRIKLSLLPATIQTLPVNYNYFLTGLIYRTLEKSSEDFSRFLHADGYHLDDSSKGFKLFTFSRLTSDRYKISGDAITFGKSPVAWHISSPVQEFIQHLVNGVFAKGQHIKIGAEGKEAAFVIEQLESLEQPDFHTPMKFSCLSPITVSKTENRSNGSSGLNSLNGLICHYIRPWEEDFSEAVKKNLIKKYRLIIGKELPEDNFEITLDQNYVERRKGKILKNINYKGTNIIGFEAPFEINASPELIKIGYEAGFGEKGSMGFGMVK